MSRYLSVHLYSLVTPKKTKKKKKQKRRFTLRNTGSVSTDGAFGITHWNRWLYKCMGARESRWISEYALKTIHSHVSWASIVGLSSSQSTVLTEGTDPATRAFPLFWARGHTVMSVREMFELWVYLCKYVSCICNMYFHTLIILSGFWVGQEQQIKLMTGIEFLLLKCLGIVLSNAKINFTEMFVVSWANWQGSTQHINEWE